MNNQYLAGIIDARGSISIFCRDKKGGFGYTLQLAISHKSSEFLEMLAGEIGGGVVKQGEAYSLRLYSAQAKKVIERVRKHLVYRKPQAEVAHQMLLVQAYRPGKRGYTDNKESKLAWCYTEMKQLNSRPDQ